MFEETQSNVREEFFEARKLRQDNKAGIMEGQTRVAYFNNHIFLIRLFSPLIRSASAWAIIKKREVEEKKNCTLLLMMMEFYLFFVTFVNIKPSISHGPYEHRRFLLFSVTCFIKGYQNDFKIPVNLIIIRWKLI